MPKRVDITGQRFGRLTALRFSHMNKHKHSVFDFVCDCGGEITVQSNYVIQGDTKSCGCLNREKTQKLNARKRVDITGQRFGRITALRFSHNANNNRLWLCRCDCGTEITVAAGALRRGRFQSCGCDRRIQDRIIEGMREKRCSVCLEYKPEAEFNRNPNSSDQLQSTCKPCAKERDDQWRKDNPGRARARMHGVTVEQVDALFETQKRACAICSSPTPRSKNGWHIDHCHETERVRGLLCHPCNIAVGFYEKHILPKMDRVAAYLTPMP